MVVIVGVTAVLVNSEPSRTLAMEMDAGEHAAIDGETTPSARPFEGTVVLGDMEAMVTVDPAAAGEQHDHDHVHGRRRAADGGQRVGVAPAVREIGPLDFTAEPDPAAPESFVVEGASLSIAGRLGAPHRGPDGRVRPR